jgi:hypothetical protein
MIKFPSIDQFRTAIKAVTYRAQREGNGVDADGLPIFNRAARLPTLKFRGAVKLHGTNAAIVHDLTDDTISFQSRERVLDLLSDNAGFALFMSSKIDLLKSLSKQILHTVDAERADPPTKIAIFGEWCGGNIQKGIGISGLPKMFVIFAVRFIFENERSIWVDLDKIRHWTSEHDQIYNILNFPTFELDIDFEKTHEAQNQLIELTIKVEDECPVGKAFGKSGVGEGLVWSCITPSWYSSDYWFKVKGEKHSASKVKVLAAVDVEAIEKISDFVDMAVTEVRLEQGLQNLVNEQLKPFDMTSMGDFIRWVFNDVVKEETDTIVASQMEVKKLGGPIANKARKWYTEKFNATE